MLKCLRLDTNAVSAHEGIPVFWLQHATLLACLLESGTVPWSKGFQSVSAQHVPWWCAFFFNHTPPVIVPIKYKKSKGHYICTSIVDKNTLLTALHIFFTSVSVLSTSVCCSQLCVYCWCLWVIVYSFVVISDSSSCISGIYKCIYDCCSALLTDIRVFMAAVVHCWQIYTYLWRL